MSYDMNEAKLADQLREERFTTKDDLIDWIDSARVRYKEKAQSDTSHSAAFYHVLDRLLVKFKDMIEETVLFEHLENYWYYSLALSASGARIFLQHASSCFLNKEGRVTVTCDQEFLLINCRTRLLTVEDYANLYGVSDGTVRQWIRRGKIRDAIKQGREWRIPELSELPSRGYSPAIYMWHSPLPNIPEEFQFLRNYSTVMINQDQTDKNLYKITYTAQGVESKTVTCDSKERERIEMVLISDPDIISIGMPDSGLNVEISCIGDTGVLGVYEEDV